MEGKEGRKTLNANKSDGLHPIFWKLSLIYNFLSFSLLPIRLFPTPTWEILYYTFKRYKESCKGGFFFKKKTILL